MSASSSAPAAAPAAATTTAAGATSSERVVRIGLFGVGRMGEVRAAAVARNARARLAFACDVDAARVEEFAQRYHCRGFTGIEQAAAAADVDAYLVCTTSATHREIILALAKHGRPIFTEKPLAIGVPATDECIKAVEAGGGTLYVGWQRRSDASFMAAAEAARGGRLGRIEMLRISSRDAASHNSAAYLASSGGYWYDSLIHDFDEARWLVGDEVAEVYAAGHSWIPSLAAVGDLSAVVVVLRFRGGAVATIDNNRRAAYGYDQRAELLGDAGMLTVENQPTSSVVIASAAGITATGPAAGFVRYAKAFEDEVNHWIAVISAAGTAAAVAPRVTHADIAAAARIADAAILSHREGRPVRIE